MHELNLGVLLIFDKKRFSRLTKNFLCGKISWNEESQWGFSEICDRRGGNVCPTGVQVSFILRGRAVSVFADVRFSLMLAFGKKYMFFER